MPELPDARRRRFVDVTRPARVRRRAADAVAGARGLFRSGRSRGRRAKGRQQLDDGRVDAGAERRRTRYFDLAGVSPNGSPALVLLIEKGTISGAIAKGVFEKMFTSGRTADEIVSAEGLTQIDDESHIQELIASVVQANPDAVKQYRVGEDVHVRLPGRPGDEGGLGQGQSQAGERIAEACPRRGRNGEREVDD